MRSDGCGRYTKAGSGRFASVTLESFQRHIGLCLRQPESMTKVFLSHALFSFKIGDDENRYRPHSAKPGRIDLPLLRSKRRDRDAQGVAPIRTRNLNPSARPAVDDINAHATRNQTAQRQVAR
ncbi:hypothetical protein [Bradyrhizobium yuanmingense]|uniref:hypothetical protein n=1 Tax=Bradyrhizobium yuanmingense TaxID=108015 RepID=UPI00055EF772|nr:hypothetical protein [Bradyrhizobium yuanmingense]